MNKPPAFQFYVKDWRSSPTVLMMDDHEKAVFIDMLVASWESDEQGTLPLPLETSAKVCGRNVRSLKSFLRKFPQTFVEVSGKLVNQKLYDQGLTYRKLSIKRREAAKEGRAKAQHLLHSASASASASATATIKGGEEGAIATKTVAKRATPLFEGFSLDAEMIAFANERGVDPKEEFDKFRDHHKAKGSLFKDWPAAFRTWVRNAVKFDRGGKDVQRAGREVPKSFDQIRVEGNQAALARILERSGISITRTQQPLRGTARRDYAIDVPREAPRLTNSKD